MPDPTLATASACQALGWRYWFAIAPDLDPDRYARDAKRRPPTRQTLATLRLWYEELRHARIAHARAIIEYLEARFGADGVPQWAYAGLAAAQSGQLLHPGGGLGRYLPAPDAAAMMGRVLDPDRRRRKGGGHHA